jgi:hypothetical protein
LDEVVSALGGLDVLGGGVTLLGLAVAAGEEDEALPVLLEALDVGLEALLGEVLTARVDRDTDGTGELAGDTGSCDALDAFCAVGKIGHTLQLNERETTAGTDTAVVLDGRAADDGPGGYLRSLGNTSIASGGLLARLLHCQISAHRRHYSQRRERGITWSKCTRT